MGHCHSSAQLGSHGGIHIRERGIVEVAPAPESSRVWRGLAAGLRSSARWILLFLVRFYITFLSAYFGGACKFYPSCSQYAQEAIARHGPARGLWLALKRLGRCRPFTQGGYDPVPDEPFAQRDEYLQQADAAMPGIHPRGEEPAK